LQTANIPKQLFHKYRVSRSDISINTYLNNSEKKMLFCLSVVQAFSR